jgi:putative NADPH-quinone reductase
MERQVRHLVIAAHPSTRSFNHTVVEAYTSELVARGHHVDAAISMLRALIRFCRRET